MATASSSTQIDDGSLSSNVPRTIGLTSELAQPIALKIDYLECTKAHQEVASLSQKFEDPTVLKKLSNIYINSDLICKVEVFDGKNNNSISIPIQTSYNSFNNKRRQWDQDLKLAIDYSQVNMDSYLKFTLLEIVDTKPVVFGVGFLTLFQFSNSTLRTGSQKIPIYTEGDVDDITGKLNYGELRGLTALEKDRIRYENGDYPKVAWLDKLALAKLDTKRDENKPRDHDYYLHVKMHRFMFAYVYSDVTYDVPVVEPIQDLVKPMTQQPMSKVLNSIDIPSRGPNPREMKIYDPDFDITANFVNATNPVNTFLDPIELKFHKLERNINNNSIIDKDLKPTPQLRDELVRILIKPSNAELSDNEKNLLWRFRYYFSKNNSSDSNARSATSKSFLPKFLKSISWENDYELDHTFKEILPLYWSVDKLQIGDALELLDSYFNPYVLAKTAYQEDRNATRSVDRFKDDANDNVGGGDDESKFKKIFDNISYLRRLAVERLKLASGEELLLYLLQLVQALKYEALIYRDVCQQNEDDAEPLFVKLPLANFLIESAVVDEKLGNFFYWYVKVENEDRLTTNATGGDGPTPTNIYSMVLNKYIEQLKSHCHEYKLPYYKHLRRQIWFIKKLTNLVELLRSSFKKNEATMRKVEFLREYLSNSSNELLKFPDPFPLPLDPSVTVCGCYPQESSVFKSSLAPLKITLKTVENKKSQTSQIFGKKASKHGKYPLMFKIGDDLRQDQLVIQIINLMDQLLKNENLDLKLTPYKILATGPVAGLIQFVPNETLDSILAKNTQYAAALVEDSAAYTEPPRGQIAASNGILNYLRLHSREQQPSEPVSKSVLHSTATSSASNMSQQSALNALTYQPKQAVTSDLGVSPVLMDNYVKSCAGYCVITYILGVGDRHLDNLLLSPNGKFWHADFGYILGRDPKPFPPLMKLPIQVIDGMGGLQHENYSIFKSYCFITYSALRKNSNLILNLFQLMLETNIPDIQVDPSRVIEKVQEKFCLGMSEEEAILHFQSLINDSVSAFLPVVIDRLHSLAQYWRA
ncbi:uncharacterized protein LODBEIA_P04950 [Lodderomyces beijingensis]|uniref:Phosphatidylinositol 3-kinase VPS34 n=1 Tax=Lodderomyces beijingensis TaxID=1775926 RepID=A0ABP0ZHH0_9ASCO